MFHAPAPRLLRAAVVVLLTLVAAALRADALVGRYGPVPGPAWARTSVTALAGLGAALRPAGVRWVRDPTPYVGGDPINYLAYGREMRSFYQPHVREPVFLALVRSQLWLLDGSDIAVSTASAAASTLVVPATYLAGTAAFGPAVGLLAAAGWAVEMDSVSWAVDGWRDDTFTLFVVLTCWALLRLQQVRSPRRAVVAGVLGGLACLTRLSSLTFIAPAFVWIVVEARRERTRMAGLCALAATTLLIVLGPYLVACARATGDPFYAVNYHTKYYRAAEGRSPDVAESAVHFIARQFRSEPLATIDTAAAGLVTWPYTAKWRGFRAWWRPAPRLLAWIGAVGLALMLWWASGRLLLVVALSSLAPYCLTWSLGGGGAWRFSEHVYPIYLMAAALVMVESVHAAGILVRHPGRWRERWPPRRRLLQATGVAALAALAWLAWLALPLLVARESLAQGRPVTIDASARDRWFFAGDWTGPHTTGAVTVRAAAAREVGVRLLLPDARDAVLTLRIDPPVGAAVPRDPMVTVFVNRAFLADLRLSYDAQRVGLYRLTVPAGMWRDGWNRLDLRAPGTVPASAAGDDFRWLAPDRAVAFRLWYVRLEPR